MTLADLGLTPTQQAEADQADPQLVTAWLEATAANTAVKNRAAWFLAGIRTRRPPQDTTDTGKARQVQLAEIYIDNAGLYLPTEDEILAELFSGHKEKGTYDLKPWTDDQPLRDRLAARWQAQQPRAQQADAEKIARAEHWKAAHPTPDETADELEQLFTP